MPVFYKKKFEFLDKTMEDLNSVSIKLPIFEPKTMQTMVRIINHRKANVIPMVDFEVERKDSMLQPSLQQLLYWL